MAVRDILTRDLPAQLSPSAKILTGGDVEYICRLQRWSDIGMKSPAAIVLVVDENDVAAAVKFAVGNNIPFVPKAGGHSTWSTIGPEGFILDLSLLRAIRINTEEKSATLQGGVTTQEAYNACSQNGFGIAAPNASRVGVVPAAIQGGNCPIVGIVGPMCDSIVSAKVATATQGLVTVSKTENPDLFWAIRGAGQFFGVVVELVMRIWPLELFGPMQSWMFMYSLEQLNAAINACKDVAGQKLKAFNGSMAIMAAPPHFEPTIMVVGQYFGPEEDAKRELAPLINSDPLMSNMKFLQLRDVTAANAALDKKGGFKGFCSTGLQHWDPESFRQVVDIWLELGEKSTVGKRSVFICNFFSNETALEVKDSAYMHRDVSTWGLAVVIGEDAESAMLGFEYAEKMISALRAGQTKDEYCRLPVHYRSGPIEEIFRGEDVLKKLRGLKIKWDPSGFFTKKLL